MSIPPILLVFIGLLATVATLGLFYQFGDPWTGVLVELAAAVLWGLFGLSAMDVVIVSDVNPPVSEPLRPLMFLGFGLAAVTFLFVLYDLATGLKHEASETDLAKFGR